MIGECGMQMTSSRRSPQNQRSSPVTLAIARYSASALEHDTVACFRDSHDTTFSPTNTQEPVVGLPVVEVTHPVGVDEYIQISGSRWTEGEASGDGTLDITQNAFDGCPMVFSWRIHVLTYLIHNVVTSGREIVRYWSAPMRLRYIVRSNIASTLVAWREVPEATGVTVSL